MILRSVLCLIAFVFASSGCSGTNPSKNMDSSPLLPMGQEQTLPSLDSGDVKAAMRAYFEQVNAPAFSQYDFVRKDLNGDHLKEALVYVTTPYGEWCNIRGCSLVILRAHKDGFSIMGSFEDLRPPFYISKRKSGDWHDIVLESSGEFNKKAEMYVLRFDGNGYKRLIGQPYVFSRKLIDASLLP